MSPSQEWKKDMGSWLEYPCNSHSGIQKYIGPLTSNVSTSRYVPFSPRSQSQRGSRLMSSKTFPRKPSTPLIKPFFEIDESISREFTRPLRVQGDLDHGEETECLVARGTGWGGYGLRLFISRRGSGISRHMGLRISIIL
jgi:hypothetical protein